MKFFNRKQDRSSSLKLAVIGLSLFSIAAIIILTDPIQMIVDHKLAMRPGSLLYDMWEKPPLEVLIKVYAFNVTNYDRFMLGLDPKIRLQEVGPYVYREYLENRNATINLENHTVTFRPHRRVEFIREKSIGDPKIDKITVPNIPYMGVTTAASQFSVFAAFGIRTLMKNLNSEVMLRNISVHDYYWGYDDQLVRLASKIIPSVIHFQKFGLLDRMFDEGNNTVTMNIPKKRSIPVLPSVEDNKIDQELHSESLVAEYQEKDHSINSFMNAITSFLPKQQKFYAPYQPEIRDFSIDSWNGQTGLKDWGYREGKHPGNTECNTLRGTYDGTLFPRNITKGEKFRIYRKSFCRTLPIIYSHPGTVDGVDAYYFKLAENAFDSDVDDPQSSCFCQKNVCLKKGLGNITPCYYNIPAAVSFPHFFNGDPTLIDGVEGLSPSEEKHGSEIVLQPQLGVPMKVHSRFQINLLMGEITFNSDMKKFKNTVLPIVWLEIGVESLTSELLILLQLLFNICPYIQIAIIFILIAAGISTLSIAALMYLWMPKHVEHFNCKLDVSRYPEIYTFPLITNDPKILTDDDLYYRHDKIQV